MQLSGKSALLTGATGGLGRAIAVEMAGRGASLILSARSPEALAEMASELPGSGHTTIPSDLSQAGAATKLATDAGDFDILVANAGVRGAGPLTDYSDEEIERAIRVNLDSPVRMARAVMERMMQRSSGHMVFIASLAGKTASPLSALYNSTKFGLRGFALGLRADLAPEGVGVSIVSPGFVREAGMFAKSGSKPPPGMGTTTPDRVADAVVRAIEHDKMEIAVAPLQQRLGAHLGMASPALGMRAQSGSLGRRAAKEATVGDELS